MRWGETDFVAQSPSGDRRMRVVIHVPSGPYRRPDHKAPPMEPPSGSAKDLPN